MPTIEITQEEQQQKLDRGVAIVVEPPRPENKRYIVTFTNGNIFDVLTEDDVPTGDGHIKRISGQCRLIAKGPHHGEVGTFIQTAIGGHGTVIAHPDPKRW